MHAYLKRTTVLAVLASTMWVASMMAASMMAASSATAAEKAPAGNNSAKAGAAFERTVAKAIGHLRSAQAEDGSYSKETGPAVTALVATALLRHGRSPSDPMVARSLTYLEGFVRKNGGVYRPKTLYRNYETCVAVLCFKEANRGGRYDNILKGADRFLKGLQWDEGEGHDRASESFGGAGYGKHRRPDMSNTSFLVEALRANGAGPDDEALQKALIFISRCQNLETEHNTSKFAAKNPDGGFYYTVAAGGSSQAGETGAGGLRSYASMTYAGLKSMIYAGVKPDDPRVKAATDWIRAHYDLSSNPGLGDAGLYYYYHTFAKTLDAMGVDEFKDAKGHNHNWRAELIEKLAATQNDDGSWINKNDRWLEGDTNLVTAYALLALSYCRN